MLCDLRNLSLSASLSLSLSCRRDETRTRVQELGGQKAISSDMCVYPLVHSSVAPLPSSFAYTFRFSPKTRQDETRQDETRRDKTRQRQDNDKTTTRQRQDNDKTTTKTRQKQDKLK